MNDLPSVRGVSRPFRRAVFALGAGLALLGWLPLRRLLGQLALALLLCAMALPLSRKMEKALPRPWAAGCAVAALALGAVGAVGMLIPPVITQISFIIAEAPGILSRFQEIWESLADSEWARLLQIDRAGPEKWIGGVTGWLGESLPALLSGIGAGIDALSRAFLAPVLAYYFLRDREFFSYKLSLWIPLRQRKRILTAFQEMRREAGGYMRGQMMVAGAVAALTGLGLLLAGVPAWLVLGLLMGACEFIPYIGPLIGGVPIALFSLPLGMRSLLWSLGITILVQQAEGYFLSPRLMAGTTGLHPVYVLLLLSAGGLIGGLPGMVIAVPAFVCLRGAARVLYETRR